MKKKIHIKSILLLVLSFACFSNIQDAFSQTAVTPPNLTTKNWHILNISTGEIMKAIQCNATGDDVKLVETTDISECSQYQFVEQATNEFTLINRQSTASHIPKGGCGSVDVDQKIRQVSGTNTSSCARWIFKDSGLAGQYRIESNGLGTWMSSADPNTLSKKVRLVPTSVTDNTTLWMLVEEGTMVTWTGATDSDWFTASNWSTGTLPTNTSTVIIPSDAANQPQVTANRGAVSFNLLVNSGASLTVEDGSSLLLGGTSSGDITYNINVPDTNWHLISSPVVGEQHDNTWIAGNNIVSSTTPGNTDNRAIGTYSNAVASNNWSYFDATPGTAVDFTSGIGYSLKRTGAGNYSFTGAYPISKATPTITQNSNNWNLVGNSFPSFLEIGDFITFNTSVLSDANQAIYVWNGTSYESLTTGYIKPGQAFFINSKVASATLDITEGLLSHQTGITFYKSNTTDQKIVLSVFDGERYTTTEITYLENKTIGLDPRFDIGLFDGESTSLKVFSNLVSNDSDIAFEKQALPNTDFENLVIPIGVKAIVDKEITFSAESFNLSEEIHVILEDRQENILTELNNNNIYKTTLSESIDVIDRFFLHTSQKSLSVNDDILNSNISMYQLNDVTLRLTGLPEGESRLFIYNILGREVLKTSFTSGNTKDISLPNLNTGVYLLKLDTVEGTVTKKVVLK